MSRKAEGSVSGNGRKKDDSFKKFLFSVFIFDAKVFNYAHSYNNSLLLVILLQTPKETSINNSKNLLSVVHSFVLTLKYIICNDSNYVFFAIN